MQQLIQTSKQYLHNQINKKKLSRKLAQLDQIQVARRSLYYGTRYGGWRVCPDNLDANSVLYSFGIGEDASFDQSIIETYDMQVFAFDPTPKSVEWVKAQKWCPNFRFYPFGIASHDGMVTFYPPEDPAHVSYTVLNRATTANRSIQVEMHCLNTITKMFDHKCIDILKMDIEGGEYEVIEDIVNSPQLEIKQILVEFHHFFPNVTVDQTYAAIAQLHKVGYRIFHTSASGNEYSFIKL